MYVPPFILQRWSDPLSCAGYCVDAKNWVMTGFAPMPWVGQWYLWQRTDDYTQAQSQSFHTIQAGLGRTPPPFWPTLECSEPRDHRPCIGSVSWPQPLLVSVSWSRVHFLWGLFPHLQRWDKYNLYALHRGVGSLKGKPRLKQLCKLKQ